MHIILSSFKSRIYDLKRYLLQASYLNLRYIYFNEHHSSLVNIIPSENQRRKREGLLDYAGKLKQ